MTLICRLFLRQINTTVIRFKVEKSIASTAITNQPEIVSISIILYFSYEMCFLVSNKYQNARRVRSFSRAMLKTSPWQFRYSVLIFGAQVIAIRLITLVNEIRILDSAVLFLGRLFFFLGNVPLRMINDLLGFLHVQLRKTIEQAPININISTTITLYIKEDAPAHLNTFRDIKVDIRIASDNDSVRINARLGWRCEFKFDLFAVH